MTQKYYSPLRYPGGKGQLYKFVKDLILKNNLDGDSYSEPYAGGASVAMGLLLEGFVSEIHINDVDVGVFNFWHSIVNETDSFLKKIWETPLCVEEWRNQQNIRRHPDKHGSLDHGFATFYLNRTNRSGVINAGVIGGLSQEGNYKIDARFNRDELSKRIVAIACHAPHINIYNQDAIKFISKTLVIKKKKGLIFLDPPYYMKGKKLYTSFYKHDDHEKVAKAIKESPHKHWIVTYDNAEEIEQIYDLKHKITYNLRYSLNHQSSEGSELLFHSDNIQLPYHPNGCNNSS